MAPTLQHQKGGPVTGPQQAHEPSCGCLPVVIRVLLSIAALGRDGADDVLGAGAHQLHRVHSQVLVQVSTTLSSIGAQVAFVFSLF